MSFFWVQSGWWPLKRDPRCAMRNDMVVLAAKSGHEPTGFEGRD